MWRIALKINLTGYPVGITGMDHGRRRSKDTGSQSGPRRGNRRPAGGQGKKGGGTQDMSGIGAEELGGPPQSKSHR